MEASLPAGCGPFWGIFFFLTPEEGVTRWPLSWRRSWRWKVCVWLPVQTNEERREKDVPHVSPLPAIITTVVLCWPAVSSGNQSLSIRGLWAGFCYQALALPSFFQTSDNEVTAEQTDIFKHWRMWGISWRRKVSFLFRSAEFASNEGFKEEQNCLVFSGWHIPRISMWTDTVSTLKALNRAAISSVQTEVELQPAHKAVLHVGRVDGQQCRFSSTKIKHRSSDCT